MITLSMSGGELWHVLQSKGYTIDITTKDHVQYVEFNGKFAMESYKLPKSYSLGFSEWEIIFDCLPKLQSWSGLKAKIVLEH